MDRKLTYWGSKGRFQALADKLQGLIPISGEVADHKANPKLERFRKAVNVYYDVFNNGACNRARSVYPTFGITLRDYQYQDIIRYSGGRSCRIVRIHFDRIVDPLDRKLDYLILDAALEQGLLTPGEHRQRIVACDALGKLSEFELDTLRTLKLAA